MWRSLPFLLTVGLALSGCGIKASSSLGPENASDVAGGGGAGGGGGGGAGTTSTLPAGAVLSFNLASCPTGWSDHVDAQGRILFGAGSGNLDAAGDALTARVADDVGGREYTTGIPAFSGAVQSEIPGPTLHFAAGAAAANYTNAAANTTLNGARADSNIPPAIARRFCKLGADAAPPTGATLYTDQASCSTGWAADTALAGRSVIGVGSGNLDADGAALTARVLNATLGREHTTGIPASTVNGNTSTPAPDKVLAAQPANTMFSPQAADTTLSGAKADGNVAPFIALTACTRAATATVEIDPGAVAAFDLASCPSGWSTYSDASGRMLLGSGSGNLDADGVALTARALGATGGYEYTRGLAATLNDGILPAPASNRILAVPGADRNLWVFTASTADTSLAGALADSNMPPYLAIRYCQKD